MEKQTDLQAALGRLKAELARKEERDAKIKAENDRHDAELRNIARQYPDLDDATIAEFQLLLSGVPAPKPKTDPESKKTLSYADLRKTVMAWMNKKAVKEEFTIPDLLAYLDKKYTVAKQHVYNLMSVGKGPSFVGLEKLGKSGAHSLYRRTQEITLPTPKGRKRRKTKISATPQESPLDDTSGADEKPK